MLQWLYMKRQHADILILGAGIAGYETFRCLKKKLKRAGSDKIITLVDQNNYFTFIPLLHEVSAGSVLPSHASFALREIVTNTPHQFVSATVTSVDPKKKLVTTKTCRFTYDTCVVALGSVSNLFNVPGAKQYTYRVRTLEQAIALNQAVVHKLEEGDRTSLTINVVGGGYTGVEIASEFAQLRAEEFTELYPHIEVTINIIQAEDKLVPLLPARARRKITARLEKLGITIHLGKRAAKVTKDTLTVVGGEEERLANDITIWVTGFTTEAPSFFAEEFVERNRIPVTNHLQLEAYKDTYVIGDMALIKDPDSDDIIYPQLAEAAHHEGMYVAKHYINELKNKPTHHFHFRSKGQLIPVGEWYGIGIFGPLVFSGKFIWWLRRTIYVLFMPGFIRKLRIVADWTFVSRSTRHLIKLRQK